MSYGKATLVFRWTRSVWRVVSESRVWEIMLQWFSLSPRKKDGCGFRCIARLLAFVSMLFTALHLYYMFVVEYEVEYYDNVNLKVALEKVIDKDCPSEQ